MSEILRSDKLTPLHLRRTAVVYVRQSTPGQVENNKESTRLQYALADQARALGFTKVTVIDGIRSRPTQRLGRGVTAFR